ncbi:MAG TPA: NIL domain-containing protein [Candidatus Binatia bacterium]|nr:NIL domain-containing protein [Candidatus Binatia bacterium]
MAPRKSNGAASPAKAKKTGKRSDTAFSTGPQKTRLWLMYPPKLITDPIIWQLAQKFPVITNVRQASVTDEIGIVCLELEGQRPDVKAAIQWLEKAGIKVEPVEINVIES